MRMLYNINLYDKKKSVVVRFMVVVGMTIHRPILVLIDVVMSCQTLVAAQVSALHWWCVCMCKYLNQRNFYRIYPTLHSCARSLGRILLLNLYRDQKFSAFCRRGAYTCCKTCKPQIFIMQYSVHV